MDMTMTDQPPTQWNASVTPTSAPPVPEPPEPKREAGQLKPETQHAAAVGPIEAVKSRSGWLSWLLGHGYVVSGAEVEALDASRATLTATVAALRKAGWIIEGSGNAYTATRRPDGTLVQRQVGTPPPPPTGATGAPKRGQKRRGRPRKDTNPESMAKVKSAQKRPKPTPTLVVTHDDWKVDDIFSAVVSMLFSNGSVPVESINALVEWREQTEVMLARIRGAAR